MAGKTACPQIARALVPLCPFALVIASFIAASGQAATLTWTGGAGDNNINSAGNWSPSQAPAGGDAFIFAGSVGLTPQRGSNLSIDSITFANLAGAFTLGGSGNYTLTGALGITNNSTNTETINNDLILGIDQTWTAAAGDLNVGGNLNLNGHVATVDGNHDSTISGVISGAGDVAKNGTGTLTIAGNANNTSSGTTFVNAGTVILSNSSGNAIGNALVVGDGTGVDSVRLQANNQINNKLLTVNSSGVLDLNGFNDTIGPLTMSGGTITTGTGTLKLGGNITSNASTTSGTISGIIDMNGNRTFNVANGSAADDLVISAKINSAPDSFTKTGAGTLVLSGSNLFTDIVINGGVINVRNNGALGNSSPIVTTGTELQLQGGITIANKITINSDGVSGAGSLRNISGNNTVTGDLKNGSTSTIGSDSGTLTVSGNYDLAGGGKSAVFTGAGNTTVSGVISNNGTLTMNGSGVLTLSGNNTYTGASTINSGTVVINSATSLGATGVTATINAGTLEVASTFSSGRNYVLGDASSTIMVDPGQTFTIGTIISGSGMLNKSATGTLVLTGNNTYTGGTTLVDGILNVGSATALNSTGTISFDGGILQYSAANNTDYSARFDTSAGQLYNIDTNGQNVTYGTALTSIGGVLTKYGFGTLSLTAANTYNGGTVVNGGTVKLVGAGTLGATSSSLIVNGGVLDLNGTNQSVGNLFGSGGKILNNASGTSTLAIGTGNATGGAYFGVIADNTSGSGTLALTKNGSGTLTISGTNTFTGATNVNNGTLVAAGISGSAFGSTVSLTIQSAATLLLGASNQINNSATMTLNGGTFATGGFSEGAAAVVGIGALSLTSNAHIDFGTGTVGLVNFASLNPGAFTLIIDNWTGTANTVGNNATDRLIFNSDQLANLGAFNFTGFGSATEISLGAGFWEVVPVIPEPSVWLGVAGLCSVAVVHVELRRRCRRRSAGAKN